jgi:hypothetical protein
MIGFRQNKLGGIREVSVSNPGRNTDFPDSDSSSQSVHCSAGTVPRRGSGNFFSTSSPVHSSLSILPAYGMQSVLVTVLLIKPQINTF